MHLSANKSKLHSAPPCLSGALFSEEHYAIIGTFEPGRRP